MCSIMTVPLHLYACVTEYKYKDLIEWRTSTIETHLYASHWLEQRDKIWALEAIERDTKIGIPLRTLFRTVFYEVYQSIKLGKWKDRTEVEYFIIKVSGMRVTNILLGGVGHKCWSGIGACGEWDDVVSDRILRYEERFCKVKGNDCEKNGRWCVSSRSRNYKYFRVWQSGMKVGAIEFVVLKMKRSFVRLRKMAARKREDKVKSNRYPNGKYLRVWQIGMRVNNRIRSFRRSMER